MLKGILFRKLFGGEGVFGKKPSLPSQQAEDLKKIKEQIETPAQPQTTVQVVEKPSPFVLMERTVQERRKSVFSPSGQVIYSNETERVEVVSPVAELTYDDLVDVVSMCRGTPVGMKFRSLLEKRFV